MKTLTAAILISVTLAMGGCASMGFAPPPSAEQLKAANYGPFDKDNAVQAISQHLRETLLDPFSYDMQASPENAIQHWAIDDNGRYHYGWMMAYSMNAKNAYGAYTGSKLYGVFFEKGQIRQIYSQNQSKTGVYPNIHTIQ